MAKSTVHKVFYNVVNAIIEEFETEVINVPDERKFIEISNRFQIISEIPFKHGYIDGTNIPITAPKVGRKDYINRRGWTSLNVQAMVDDRCRYAIVISHIRKVSFFYFQVQRYQLQISRMFA